MPEEKEWGQQEEWLMMPVIQLVQPTLQVIASATCKGKKSK